MKRDELKSGVFLSYFSILLGFIISLIYTPYMLGKLGQQEYGVYQLTESIVNYLNLLTFGFSSVYIRYYSKYKFKQDDTGLKRLNGMFFIVFFVIAILTLCIGSGMALNAGYIIGTKFSSAEIALSRNIMFVMVLNICVTLLGTTNNVYILANEKFTFQKIVSILKTVFSPILICVFLSMGYRSLSMAIINLVLSVFAELLLARYAIKHLKMQFNFKKFDFPLMREMTVFCSFIFLNMIIDQINWGIDKFLLGRICGATQVAIYSVAAQINTYYMMLSTQISGVFVPKVNMMVAKMKDATELTELFIKIGRIQFYVLFLVVTGFILLGKQFIYIWVGQEYSEAYYVVLLLIVPAIVPLTQNIGIEIQKALNRHKFRSVVYSFIAIFNLILSIPLANWFESIGVASGTAISLVIGNVFLMNWYYNKYIGLDIKQFFIEIGGILIRLLVPFIIMKICLMNISIHSLLEVFIYAIIYIAIYVIYSYYLVFNMSEKELVRGSLLKFKSKIE